MTSSFRGRTGRLSVGLAVLAGAIALGTGSSGAVPAKAVQAAACRGSASPATWDHVILIVMENHDYAQVAGHSPYLNGLASRCGLATNYTAVTHPSLPNYMAMTSGGTQGITSDCTKCSTDAASIFSQVGQAGWTAYEQDMPSVGFEGPSSGNYVRRHNPAAYYNKVAGAYRTNAVPMGTPTAGRLQSDLAHGKLARYNFVTPDLVHDEHDGSVASGDAWLAVWVPKILASPAYRAGRTALFVTYDENDHRDGNHVYTVVVSPSTPAHTMAGAAFNHYSLLATQEDMLGVGRLGSAAPAPSMRAAFHL